MKRESMMFENGNMKTTHVGLTKTYDANYVSFIFHLFLEESRDAIQNAR